MSGPSIAAEVADALQEAAGDVGVVSFVCTIRRASSEPDEPATPWDDPADPVNEPTYFEVNAIQKMEKVRDASGMFLGVRRRVLTIDALAVVPTKADTIAVGIASDDVVEGTTGFEEIDEVVTVAPGGYPLAYRLNVAV